MIQGPEEVTMPRPLQGTENVTLPYTLRLAPDRVAKGKQSAGCQRIHRRYISSSFPSGQMVAAGCPEWSYVQFLRRDSVAGDSKTPC